MVTKVGTDAVDILEGGPGQDDLKGGGGDDLLKGLGSNDSLSGGDGDDVLLGGTGQDILRGQRGADKIEGEGDADTLYALGDSRSALDIAQDSASDNSGGLIPRSEVSSQSPDTLTGGTGEDLFYIQESAEGEGFGFYPGQQYAIITDFESGEDKIRLPGATNNYTTNGYDSNADGNNDSTAIIYTEDPNLDASIGVGVISIGGGRTLEVAKDDTLVALVENASVGNLTDSDFYIYGSTTDP